MEQEKHSFWKTVPGILTGAAVFVAAIVGSWAVVHRPGSKEQRNQPAKLSEATPSAPIKALLDRPTRARLNLEGSWRDANLGHTLRLTQEGNRILSVTIDPLSQQTLARGQALLKGRSIEGSNEWMNGDLYAVSLRLSEDGKELTGISRNAVTHQATAVRFVR